MCVNLSAESEKRIRVSSHFARAGTRISQASPTAASGAAAGGAMNSRFRLFRDLDSDGDGTLSYKVGLPDPSPHLPLAPRPTGTRRFFPSRFFPSDLSRVTFATD